jgi:O-antigen/teichoic acid export membrane protein
VKRLLSTHRASSVATVVVQVLELAAQLAAGIVIARGLGAEDFGRYVVATGLAGLAAVVLSPGTNDVVMQMVSQGADVGSVLHAAMVRIRQGAARAAGVLIVGAVIAGVDARGATVVCVVGLSLVLSGCTAALASVVIARDRSWADALGFAVSRLVLVAVAAIGAAHGSLLLASMGGLLAAAVLLLLRLQLVRSLIVDGVRCDQGIADEMRRSARKIGVGVVAGSIAARADVFALQRLASSVDVGVYGAAYRVIAGVLAIAQALALAAHPQLARAFANRDRATVVRVALVPLSIAIALVVAALTSLSSWLVIVFGDDFAASCRVLNVLFVAGACQVLNTFSNRALTAAGHPGALVWWQLGLAVAAPVLHAFGAFHAGAMGAAWATLSIEALLLLGSVVTWRVLGVQKGNTSVAAAGASCETARA